jgi:hypothetical protein
MSEKKIKSSSGIEIKEVYTESKSIELPGEFPFTRGIQKDMYRGKMWTMRQYAGFSTAAESNNRYHYLLSQGTTGLSVAFDLPTQIGYDSDHMMSEGEVGKVGVAIDSLRDMEILFDGIDLQKVSSSMTINATAPILLAMYICLAKKQDADLKQISGTIQNDILKEYAARGTYIYPPKASMRLITDIFEFCSAELPKWNTISISGYHIREAGSTAVQELAFTLANGKAYLQAAMQKGLDINVFAKRLSFFFNCHNNFFEEIANVLSIRGISTFSPVRSVPGSWVQFLHMNLSPNESTKLGKAIALLSSEEDINSKERQDIEENINNEKRQEIARSWRDCATLLKRENLKVDLAISTNEPGLYLVSSISTEDVSPMEDSEPTRIIVLSHDVPQADNLKKVLLFVSLLIQDKSSIEIVREKFLKGSKNSSRNFSYYRQAAEVLGLIDWRSHPTNASFVLNHLPTTEKKMRLLASQFLSSNVGSSWLKWSSVNDLSDVQPDSAYQFLIEVCPSLSKTTAKRRAETLESWLEVFLQYW